MARFEATAVYVRRSKEEQSEEHQLDDIRDWLDQNDLAVGDVDMYAEHGSGAKRTMGCGNGKVERARV